MLDNSSSDDLDQITPIKEITSMDASIRLSIKRDDLNDPFIQGNKWRKLKYNLAAFYEGNYSRIISFGGAFSNHVSALASLSDRFNIPCTLFIRANELDEKNPTIQYLQSSSVDIRLLNYTQYKEKNSQAFLKSLVTEYENPLIIPEGGTNEEGMQGSEELGKEIIEQCGSDLPDYLAVSAGTGGTAAGLIKAFKDLPTEVLVFSSLKGDFLKEEIAQLCGLEKFQLVTEYHFKGYGKFSTTLIDFINQFKQNHKVLLDPVYTGKMMYGIEDLRHKGFFGTGASVLAVHTGGLQGIAGYNYRYAAKYGRIAT